MELTINRLDLHKALQKVITAVPSKTTLPILTNVLLTVEKKTVTITGTDLEISVKTSVPADVVEEGATTVSARTFNEIVRELPDTGLRITSDERQRVTITTDRGTYTLMGQSPEDYPSVTVENYENRFQIGAEVFERLIQRSTFAVATDALKPALSGVYIEVFPSELRLVATDGHRLSKVVYRKGGLTTGESKAIVPPKGLLAAQRAIGEGVSSIEIALAKNHVTFRADKTEVCAKQR
jgi:DNA polymerase-3 subunit beta